MAWYIQAGAVVAAGSVGCGLRSLVRDGLVGTGVQAWGAILLINVLGAGAMGAAAAALEPGSLAAVTAGGVLAGWTTYSAFSVDVLLLWRSARRAAAAVCWAATMLGTPLAAWAAWWSCREWGQVATAASVCVAVAALVTAVHGVRARRQACAAAASPESRDTSAWHDFLVAAVLGGVLGSAGRAAAALATSAAGAPEWSSRLVVNLLGAYGAGILVARMQLREEQDPRLGQPRRNRVREHLWMTGVLGGFTTVSGFAFDAAHAASMHAWPALGVILGTNAVLGLAAAWLGLRWGRASGEAVSQ